MEQRHCLAHHVATHEGAVSVVVLEEGDKCRRHGGYLLGRHIHEVHFLGLHHGEVGVEAAFHHVAHEGAILSQGGVALANIVTLLFLGSQIHHIVVVQVHGLVGHLTVRSLDETEVVDGGIDAERGDKTDVGAFRALNGAEASIMCIVHIAHFETGTFAGETAGAQCREAAFVGHLGQRVGLVHELAQRIGAEEGVDDTRYSFGINQVDRFEHITVAHVHTLTDSAAHTGQTDGELRSQLLAHRAHTTVGEVVDIVDHGIRVDQLYEIFNNLNDILFRQDALIHIRIQIQLLVDAVASHLTQVIPLVREEEVLYQVVGSSIIGRLGIAQLAVDILRSFLLRVGCVFLQCLEDNGITSGHVVFLVKQDDGVAAVEDILGVLLGNLGVAGQDHIVSLDGDNLTGILIVEVLKPALEHIGGQFASVHLLEILLVHLDLLGQSEYVEDILVRLVAYGTEQCGDRKFLLTVDVSVHHVVDVGSKLYPRALEGNDAGRIELGAVGMLALSEEHAGRAMQLRDHDTLSTIDDKGAVAGHIRYSAQEDIRDYGMEILMFRVGAIEFHLRLERHTVCEAALQALLDGISGRIDEIIKKLEHEIVPRVGDGEIL